MDSLSFKENAKYEVIQSKLRLDNDRNIWVAAYPFNTDIEKLIDSMSKPEAA
jgi:hypothetical protein